MKLVIVPGSNYVDESRRLAKLLGVEFVETQHKLFPDGENYVRLNNVEAIRDNVVLISNTMYPAQNDSFIEILMLINAAYNAGASTIHVFIPYLAYMRQDKVFQPGEPVTADIIVTSLKNAGVKCVFTVDAHSPAVLDRNLQCYNNIIISDILVQQVLKNAGNPLIIAPDKGAIHRAEFAAKKFNLEYDYLIKERDRVTGEVSIKPKEVSVKDKTVVIIDDIISTGGTIVEASRFLYKLGAREVYVCATHGLLIGNAIERILDSGVKKIITANTLGIKHENPRIEYVDIIPYVASVLKNSLLK